MTLGQTERPHAAGVEEACETEPMTLLPPNARIAVVAPAGPIHPERLDAGLDVLRRWGFTPVEAPALRHRHDLFAGTLADRTADLEWALTDPDLHAVWFARGGYGTAEVVHALDPSALCVPRLVIGYSDATALISARVNLHQPSLHGPVVQELGAWPDDALTPLHRTLTQDSPWTLPGHQLAGPPRTVEGTLAGGNLTVLASLVGTPHALHPPHLLVLEDVHEAAYRLDRCWLQLHLSGAFDQLRGVCLGTFTHCDPTRDGVSPEELLARRFASLDVPVLGSLPIGHGAPQLPWLAGANALLTPTSLQTG